MYLFQIDYTINNRVKVIEKAAGKTNDLAEKVGELKNQKQSRVVVITAWLSSIYP
ncbi:hypothetical protein [Microcystis aeruginosa]|uniref:hypothetical protein n=1 Tax=Microcystis TaxID=1125 RepID=UPI00232CF5A9|nr:hypothetical protein [Microcystis aeruginosa]MDB9508897.1 hypothetical protein [Microcystis aeruginosa CS-338/01]